MRFRLLRNDRLHASGPQTNARFAQPKGLGLKVGDEFTVPLCAIHHHQIHITGKENAWWQERKIDPLKVAASLWQQSPGRQINPRVPQNGAAQTDSQNPESTPAYQALSAIDANVAIPDSRTISERKR